MARLDAEMFAAFNTHDVDKLMAYFAPNLEFFHDKGGLSDFSQTKAGFTRLFAQSPDISRTLVPGSLEVFPVKGYGAMHIATQRFCHVENGRNDCGNSKFVMVWQQQADTWKITRVVSYDHGLVPSGNVCRSARYRRVCDAKGRFVVGTKGLYL